MRKSKRRLSKETKIKLSKYRTGKKHSEETKAKMRSSSKGISEEHREKMKQGVVKYLEKKKIKNEKRDAIIAEAKKRKWHNLSNSAQNRP